MLKEQEKCEKQKEREEKQKEKEQRSIQIMEVSLILIGLHSTI